MIQFIQFVIKKIHGVFQRILDSCNIIHVESDVIIQHLLEFLSMVIFK